MLVRRVWEARQEGVKSSTFVPQVSESVRERQIREMLANCESAEGIGNSRN